MTPSYGSLPRLPKPRAASPAERGAEFAAIQRELKREAAERRAKSAGAASKADAARTAPHKA
jgi:hypothetical protein